jgi:hypothetical protein
VDHLSKVAPSDSTVCGSLRPLDVDVLSRMLHARAGSCTVVASRRSLSLARRIVGVLVGAPAIAALAGVLD